MIADYKSLETDPNSVYSASRKVVSTYLKNIEVPKIDPFYQQERIGDTIPNIQYDANKFVAMMEGAYQSLSKAYSLSTGKNLRGGADPFSATTAPFPQEEDNPLAYLNKGDIPARLEEDFEGDNNVGVVYNKPIGKAVATDSPFEYLSRDELKDFAENIQRFKLKAEAIAFWKNYFMGRDSNLDALMEKWEKGGKSYSKQKLLIDLGSTSLGEAVEGKVLEADETPAFTQFPFPFENTLLSYLYDSAKQIQDANVFYNARLKKYILVLPQNDVDDVKKSIDKVQNLFNKIFTNPAIKEFLESNYNNAEIVLDQIADRLGKLQIDFKTSTRGDRMGQLLGFGRTERNTFAPAIIDPRYRRNPYKYML